jgi:hypothetical protein
VKVPALGTRKQAILFGVLAIVLLFAVVKWSGRDRTPAAPPPASVTVAERRAAPVARGGKSRRTVGPDEIPLIGPRDLDPQLRGGAGDTGRDLFDFREPTPTPPPVPTPAPTIPPVFGPPGPPPPPPTPAPPDIPFRLVGIFGPANRPIAALANGNEILNAREKDVILRAYIIQKIGYESIDVGFVGFPPTESRRLAISPEP